jgi:hypothetical protein
VKILDSYLEFLCNAGHVLASRQTKNLVENLETKKAENSSKELALVKIGILQGGDPFEGLRCNRILRKCLQIKVLSHYMQSLPTLLKK